MTNKQLAMKTIRQMPDEATLEEIVEQLRILAAVLRGQKDIEAGRFIAHKEMKRQVAEWLSK